MLTTNKRITSHEDLFNLDFIKSKHTNFQRKTYYQTSAPTTNLNIGDLFFNTTDSKFNVYNGSSWDEIGGGSSTVIYSTYPTVNDDNTAGYEIGSLWMDTSKETLYICEDATTGAAIWTTINNMFELNFGRSYDATLTSLNNHYNGTFNYSVFPKNSGIFNCFGYTSTSDINTNLLVNSNNYNTENNGIFLKTDDTTQYKSQSLRFNCEKDSQKIDIFNTNCHWDTTVSTTEMLTNENSNYFQNAFRFYQYYNLLYLNCAPTILKDTKTAVNRNIWKISKDDVYYPRLYYRTTEDTVSYRNVLIGSDGKLYRQNGMSTGNDNNNYRLIIANINSGYGQPTHSSNVVIHSYGIKYISSTNTTFNENTDSNDTPIYCGGFTDVGELKRITDLYSASSGVDNLGIGQTTGRLLKNTSSTRYKDIFNENFDLTKEQIETLLNIQIKQFNYFNDTEKQSEKINGFWSIAPLVEELVENNFHYLINYSWISDDKLTIQLKRKNINKSEFITKYSVDEQIISKKYLVEEDELTREIKQYLLPNSINKANMDTTQSILIRYQHQQLTKLKDKVKTLTENFNSLYQALVDNNILQQPKI